MTTVDGYTRVSTDPQEENTSFEEQERAIRQYCAENGLTVGIIHRENLQAINIGNAKSWKRCGSATATALFKAW